MQAASENALDPHAIAPQVGLGRLSAGRRFTMWLAHHSAQPAVRAMAACALLALGCVLCARLFGRLDWHALLGLCSGVGPGAVLVIALLSPVVGNLVHTLGWQALLAPEWRLPFWRAFRVFVAAQAGNELGFGVLGEPLKVVSFPREQRAAAAQAVVLDNLTALGALFAVVLSALAVLGLRAPLGIASRGYLGVALAVGVVSSGAWLLRSKWRLLSGTRPSAVLLAFLAHYLGKLWIVAEMWLVLAVVGTASLRSGALLGLASTIGAALGAPVPGQLGVVEAALSSVAAAAGISVTTALSVALLRRVRSLFWVLLGGLFFWQLCAVSGPSIRAVARHRNGATRPALRS